MTSWLVVALDLVDALDGEAGLLADVRGLLGGDADLAELGLRLAGQDLDLLPDLELVLECPRCGPSRGGCSEGSCVSGPLAVVCRERGL